MKKRRRGPVETPGLDVLGPLQEIIRQVRKGDLTVAHLQLLVQHRNPFTSTETGRPTKPAKPLAVADAISILGAAKVITAEQAAKAQDIKVPAAVPIRFSEATLRERARSNAVGNTDWRLCYVFGTSLRESHEKFGTDQNHQPCFNRRYNWWLTSAEDGWAQFRPDGRYYLIDFNGRFGMTSWYRQEEEIQKFRPRFRRCHEAVLTEAVFSIFKTTGERLPETWWHWGVSRDSGGYRVCVGGFDLDGWCVGDRPDGGGVDLHVCLEEVPEA